MLLLGCCYAATKVGGFQGVTMLFLLKCFWHVVVLCVVARALSVWILELKESRVVNLK